MEQIGQSRTIEEEDVEIKLIPIDDYFIIQVSSGVVRGTLILDKYLEKSELVEFSEALYDLMQQYDMYGNTDIPQ